MSRFAAKSTPVRRDQGAVTTTTQTPDRLTHQGGSGFTRDVRGELFLTAVTHLEGKDTFYESSGARSTRFRDLVVEVAEQDPDWLAGFIPWLRDEAGIRTASVVAAVEFARIVKGAEGRKVVSRTFQRADEPAEALAYFMSRYGRRVPKAIKKGLADAAVRLYGELTILKYDSSRHGTRPADVIALCHPQPENEHQSAVFTALLDRRHGHKPKPETLELLPKVKADLEGESSATWERASGDGKVDWSSMILDGKMGVMALLRNLRNFDQDGISDEAFARVKEDLTRDRAIRGSRVFPLRFVTAWEALDSLRWGETLEQGLELSLANVPRLEGHTLVLWDCSGSMKGAGYYGAARKDLWRQAGVFAVALARRAEAATVVPYSDRYTFLPEVASATSTMRLVEAVSKVPDLWRGTYTWPVLQQVIQPEHDRVVIVTDEQAYGRIRMTDLDQILGQRPCYILNVAGYEPASAPSDRVITFGGFNDRAFTAISQAEAGLKGEWPWEK